MSSSAAGRTVRFFTERGPVGLLIGLALAAVMLSTAVSLVGSSWGLLAGVVAALCAAKLKWPMVRVAHYFRSSKAALPGAAAAGGWGAQAAIESLTQARPDLLMSLVGGAVAAGALGFVMVIFEGKLMKSIFDLVPAEQKSNLSDFVNDKSSTPDARGKFADFSNLDPAMVTAAIKERVIGQAPIIDDVVGTAFRRARLRRPNKPVAVFLMVGATGAGKTELSKALSAEMFDGRMIRVDCNELSQPHNVARLVGAPPGYVGSDQGGQLCRDIGRVGTGVLLFDEIEKADPAVMKVIMSLLDEARLTEQSTGTTYSSTGFLIVLTSNAAASGIAKVAASVSDPSARAAAVKDELKNAGFLPEVLARIDSIFPFSPLGRGAVIEIVGRFLMAFARDAGVQLVSVDSALLVDLVTKQEKMADYGAREVVRLVENTVVDGLLSVKDAGHARAAIRVVDGRVLVEPAAGA